MVDIVFVKDANNNYIGADIKGHANYNPGNDIVCSAVSALGYALIGALNNSVDDVYVKAENSGEIMCRLKEDEFDNYYLIPNPFEESNIIFETIYIGMLQIEKAYPDNVSVVIAID